MIKKSGGLKTVESNESSTQMVFDKFDQDSEKNIDHHTLTQPELSDVNKKLFTLDDSVYIDLINRSFDKDFSEGLANSFEDLLKLLNKYESITSEHKLILRISKLINFTEKQDRLNWISRGALGYSFVRKVKKSKGGRGNKAPNGWGQRINKLAEIIGYNAKNLSTEVNMYKKLVDDRIDYANESPETIREKRRLFVKEISLFTKEQCGTAVNGTKDSIAAIRIGIKARETLGDKEKYTHAMFLEDIKELLTKDKIQNSSTDDLQRNTIVFNRKLLPQKVRAAFDKYIDFRKVNPQKALKIIVTEYLNIISPLLQEAEND